MGEAAAGHGSVLYASCFMVAKISLAVAALGTLSSTVFLALAMMAAARHKGRVREQAARHRAALAAHDGRLPAVSLLKPVHGLEPRLRENLESFFRQDHPQMELLFCARRRDDPALQLVDELTAKYPAVQVRVLAGGEPAYPNAKVFSLELMAAHARHEVLIMTDSDVEAGPGFARALAAPFLQPKTGVVTALYRGRPAGGIWSRMEGLGMSVEMNSGVLIAAMLEGIKFALGPGMAMTRTALTEIGGLGKLGTYCADDFMLGNMADQAGYRNEFSAEVIDHVVLNRGWLDSWKHQVRWMKSTRFSRPKGHLGTGLTFAMPFGVLGMFAAWGLGHPEWGLALLGWAVANRTLQSVVIGWGVVRDRRALRDCWLYCLRDLLGFFLWLASYGSDVIEWRGERYRLAANGKMERTGKLGRLV